MGVLYIIGNGVDIGLGLPTRYTEFRDWLKENRPKDFQKISKFYSANDEYWSDLENNLAKINIIGTYSSVYSTNRRDFNLDLKSLIRCNCSICRNSSQTSSS